MEKLFIVGIKAGYHLFEYKCNTISDAYEAVQAAVENFGIEADMDWIMRNLVNMECGATKAFSCYRLTISAEQWES